MALTAKALFRLPIAVRCGFPWGEFAKREGRWDVVLLDRLVRRWVEGSADAVILTGRYGWDPASAVLIPNGVDLGRFRPGGARQPLLICWSGRLAAQKQLDTLLQAVAGVPGSVLRLIGDGPQRARLGELAHALGVQVEWVGAVPNEAVAEHLKDAGAFVFPSAYEGDPKSLVEAMACGLPVIASDIPAHRAIIRHGETGWLVPADPAALRAAIEGLRREPDLALRLGRAARDWVAAHRNLHQLVKEECDVIERAAGGRTGTAGPTESPPPAPPARDRIWRRMGYEYGGGMVGALISAMVLVVLAQRLSVEEFGLYQVMLNLVVMGVVVLNGGLPSVLSRYIPECLATGRSRHLRRLVRLSMGLVLLGGLTGWALTRVIQEPALRVLGQESLAPLAGLLWTWVTARMLVQVTEAAVDALRGQVPKNRLSILLNLAQVPVLIWVLRMAHMLPWLVGSFILADGAVIAGHLAIIWRRTAEPAAPPAAALERRPLAERAIRFGLREYASTLLTFCGDLRMDLFLISAIMGASAAGLFGFAMALMNTLWVWSPGTLLRAISRPLFVERQVAVGDGGGVNRIFQWYMTVSALFAVPLFTGAILLYAVGVRLFFRPEYLAAGTVVVIAGLGMLIKVLLDPLRNVLFAIERVEILTRLNLFAATRAAVSALLIWRWGLTGAAAAFALYVGILTGFLIWWTRRHAGVRMPWGSLKSIALGGAGMALVLLAGRGAIHSIWSLAGVAAAAPGVYFLAVLRYPPFGIAAASWRYRLAQLLAAIRCRELTGASPRA